jgi:hypothetical protein
MGFDLKKAVGQIAKNAPNMQEAQKGGGDYEPPAAGPCFLRFIGYIELGKQKSTYKGETKIKDKVRLIFEVHGKNYPPKKLDDGTLIPTRITITETLSLSEKAHFFKIFNSMRNNRSEITHMAQMLGEGFLGRITHNTGKEDKVYANLRNDAGYSIRPPYREDPETGESTKLKVPEAISELRLFVWDQPSKEMWDSLFIDGEYEEGKTKNVIQQTVLAAVNYKGSPLEQLLAGAMPDDDDPDGDEDTPDDDPGEDDPSTDIEDQSPQQEPPKKPKAPAKPAPKPKPKPAKAASADPLDGIGDDDIPY